MDEILTSLRKSLDAREALLATLADEGTDCVRLLHGADGLPRAAAAVEHLLTRRRE